MAQCLMTFDVIGSIEPSSLTTPGGIMHPGLPPHTPYLGTPVVFPPGQRPVSFFMRPFCKCKFNISFAAAAKLALVCSAAKLSLRLQKSKTSLASTFQS